MLSETKAKTKILEKNEVIQKKNALKFQKFYLNKVKFQEYIFFNFARGTVFIFASKVSL